MKCPKSISKDHVWEPLSINSSFTGTVGYYVTYVLKCAACDIVDDLDKIAERDYRTGEYILNKLIGIKECRRLKKHDWTPIENPSVLSQKSICRRCTEIEFYEKGR